MNKNKGSGDTEISAAGFIFCAVLSLLVASGLWYAGEFVLSFIPAGIALVLFLAARQKKEEDKKKELESKTEDKIENPGVNTDSDLLSGMGFEIKIDGFSNENERDYLFTPVSGKQRLNRKNYVVLDVETTGLNPEVDSIIEIGAIKVINGEKADEFERFVNPGCPIPARITALTGIQDSDVKFAGEIDSIVPELHKFLENAGPIVGYNVVFDLKFLSAAFSRAGLPADWKYIDAMGLAKRAFPGMRNYKLETLISELNLLNHAQKHRALDDTEAAFRLYFLCREKLNKSTKDNIRHESGSKLDKPIRRAQIKITDIKPTVTEFNTENPLYHKKIIFTGNFTISREAIMQIAVNCGAVLREKPSGKTDFLVIGEKDAEFVDENGMSYKERKAYEFNNAGKGHIKFLNEDEFMGMVRGG